jgi:hypothetical protein
MQCQHFFMRWTPVADERTHVLVQTESMLLKVQVYITERTGGPSRQASEGPTTSGSSQQQQQQQQQQHSWGGTSGEGLRHRHPASSSGRTSENGDAAAGGPEVPLEQRVLVNTILKSKDYYEILSVSRTASDDDIKKSYRKVGHCKALAPRAATLPLQLLLLAGTPAACLCAPVLGAAWLAIVWHPCYCFTWTMCMCPCLGFCRLAGASRHVHLTMPAPTALVCCAVNSWP